MSDEKPVPSEPDEMDLGKVHGSILREHQEPGEGRVGVPTWLVALVAGLVFWGGFYLAMNSGGFRADVFNPAIAVAAGPVDPAMLGQRTFTQNCLVCHQPNGQGIPRVAPPLVGGGIVLGREGWRDDQLVALVLHGLSGPVTVRGEIYNGVMAPWRHLRDDEIAAVLTYIRSSWGNAAPKISPGFVRAVRERTADQIGNWSLPALRAMPILPPSPAKADANPSAVGH